MNKQEILDKMFDMDRRYSEEFKQLQQAANALPDEEHGRAQPLMDLVEKWRMAFTGLEKYCERLEIDNKKLSEENNRLRMELDSTCDAKELRQLREDNQQMREWITEAAPMLSAAACIVVEEAVHRLAEIEGVRAVVEGCPVSKKRIVSEVASTPLLSKLKRIRREIVNLEMRPEVPDSVRLDMGRAREALLSAGVSYQFDTANVEVSDD